MKKKYIKCLVVISLMLNVSCVSSDYTLPSLSDELRYNEEVTKRYTVDREWWKQYQNDVLDELIVLAMQNNPDYITAAININKQLYNLNLASTDLFPTFYSSLGASSQREISKSDSFSSNFSGELGLKYELDLYGKIRDEKSAQEFEYKATVLDKETAKISLVNSVVDLYFNLKYLSNSIDASVVNVVSYQTINDIVEEKYNNGKIDHLELVQARQSLLTEKNKLISFQTQYREMEQSLRNVLNLKPDENLNLYFSNILEQERITVDLDVPLSVLANRPDLLASQYRLEKAFKNLNAEEKNWYPSVSLNGLVGSSSDKARTTFDFPYIMGAASIDLPFLDWNRVKNNIKISEADYQISLIDFKGTLIQALNETAYYHFAYVKSIETFNNTKENYENAIKIKEYYQVRYDAGKVEFKDLLEAISNQNSTKKDLIQQKYQIIKYENYIYKAMNGRYKSV